MTYDDLPEDRDPAFKHVARRLCWWSVFIGLLCALLYIWLHGES